MDEDVSLNQKDNLMTNRSNLIVLFVCAAVITVAEAAETEQSAIKTGGVTDHKSDTANTAATVLPTFKFGGFGSLGVSHSSQDLGDYVPDSTIPHGAGRSSNWATGNDSRIGLQVTGDFTPKVSTILQVIVEYEADNTYRPTVEWANVKYAFSPDAYLRGGRIALPTFLNSDNRKVGYSYPWIHPPVELYRQLAITNSDGIDAMYRSEIGEFGNSIRAIYGSNTIERATSVSTSKDLWGIFDTIEYGEATIRIGYQERIASSRNILTGVVGASVKNSDLSVGANYDPGDWFVMTEWIQRQSTTKIDAMYVSAGYRVDKFTPYLTYSQDSPASFLSGNTAPTASAIQSAKKSQSTVSLGVRWDFMRKADFKVQYDQVRLGSNSNGNLTNVPANVILYGSQFHVLSAVFDFVY